MDGQMRLVALVVGLVFLIGTATLVVSSNVFNYKPFDASRALTQDAELSDSTARRQQGRRTSRLQVSESDAESLTARTRVVRLENQLQQRTNELNERNTRIDDLNTQLRALRSTPSRESRATSQPRTPTRSESPAPTTDEPGLRNQIDRLNQDLLAADLQEAEYQQEISRLRDSLDRVNEELDLLEDGTDAELNNSANQHRRRQRVIGDLVARFGSDSVPLLVDFLEEDDQQLRVWALQVLGQLGDDADDALEDITVLFEDPSADVRNAARKAVDSIRGR